MIAFLVSRQLGLHAATCLDKQSLALVTLVGRVATLALTLLTYAHTAVSQVVHVKLPHLALAHLPSCQVHMLGEVINLKQPVQSFLHLRNGN